MVFGHANGNDSFAFCAYRFSSAAGYIGVCKDEGGTIPSPGGRWHGEAVTDEEWRNLTIRYAVNSNVTIVSNVPFYRNAHRFGTYRRSSSAPVCALGHLPPGGRYFAPSSQPIPIYRAAEQSLSTHAFFFCCEGLPCLHADLPKCANLLLTFGGNFTII